MSSGRKNKQNKEVGAVECQNYQYDRGYPTGCRNLLGPQLLAIPKNILKLAKKLGLKTKNLQAEIVKERIGQIWVNKTIIELDLLFKNNPDWWHSTTVIFAQLTAQQSVKNVKKINCK